MANTLDVLIQVAERKVEDMQRQLAKTRGEINQITEDMVTLDREAAVAFVTAVAEDDVMALQAAGAFQERIRREIVKLKQKQADLQIQEGKQRKQLQELYAGQKKYELLLEKQKLEVKKERAKKAQNNLDEVAGRRR